MSAHSVRVGAWVVAATAVASLVAASAPGLASQLADDVLKVAIRSRGTTCPDPVTADPDAKASHPDQTAWIVHCKEGDFRVIFKGDTGPVVERLGS